MSETVSSLQSCKLHKQHIYLQSILSFTINNKQMVIIKAKLYRVVNIIWIQLCIQLRGGSAPHQVVKYVKGKQQNRLFTLNYFVCVLPYNGLYAIFPWGNLTEWDICWGKGEWTVFYSFTLCTSHIMPLWKKLVLTCFHFELLPCFVDHSV